MGIWSGIKKGLDFVFYIRPKQWFNWDFMKSSTSETIEIVKNIYRAPQKGSTETFFQAIERHRLSVQDLHNLRSRFFYISLFFFVLAIGMSIYALTGFLEENYLQFLGSASLVFFLLAQSFRYHFWYFQIVQKRLGCSFREWFNFLIS